MPCSISARHARGLALPAQINILKVWALNHSIIPVANMEADTPSARDQAIDMHTLAAIYDQYYPLIYRYVRYRLDSVPLVEDITSEVFIRLLEVLQKQRLITNLRGWLFGAASNIIHTH
ncbi:MAG: sigma-70 family RNA polymerase sigma factor, partial [Anaerolineaceae bacterium]|nr:sigma-70 family RNA polymerase sigma factor [Anaerolineaceae bacterium]